MPKHAQTLLTLGSINGAVEVLERVLEDVVDKPVDAVAVVGDLAAPLRKPETYRDVFKALGEAGKPTFWIPGSMDAPLSDYLRESSNIELVYEHLRGVHGTAAVGPDHILFAGIGGEIVDDVDAVRSEEALIRYPGWEAEYRLKVIREFKDYPKVLLFTTRPAHKGLHEQGSETVAELINTYKARIAVVAGEEGTEERLGTTLVVSPGRVDQGSYALVDLHKLSVQIETVAVAATV